MHMLVTVYLIKAIYGSCITPYRKLFHRIWIINGMYGRQKASQHHNWLCGDRDLHYPCFWIYKTKGDKISTIIKEVPWIVR